MNELNEFIKSTGGLKPASDLFGISYQALQKWISNGHVPMERVPSISKITGIDKIKLNSKYI